MKLHHCILWTEYFDNVSKTNNIISFVIYTITSIIYNSYIQCFDTSGYLAEKASRLQKAIIAKGNPTALHVVTQSICPSETRNSANPTACSILTLYSLWSQHLDLWIKKSVRCQSADPTITADLHPQADASAVRTPLH